MRKLYVLLISFFALISTLNAQTISATTYPFAASSGATLQDMSTGTTQLVAANSDDGTAGLTNIGFDFWYVGVRYTQFDAGANGLVRMGTAITTGSSNYTNSLASTNQAPVIAPYWDDLYSGATTGKVHYKVVGTAPNRILVIEWKNMQVPRVGASTAGAATFQAWLYETTGKIEYYYGAGMATNSANSGASIGLGNSATVFASVTLNATSASSTVNYATVNNANTIAITSGTKFTFTPAIPGNPGALTFSNIGLTSMTLNWSDNATNEVGYVVYKSTDGVNYVFEKQIAANSTSTSVTGLSPATLYYWKVYAVTEGALSNTPVSGSQSTSSCPSGVQTFTIDNTLPLSATNFPSFTSAITYLNSLNSCTPSGTITFNVTAGQTFAESSIPFIVTSGTATFPVIFQKAGAGANPIISSAGSTGTESAIGINGADYITFDGINISASGSTLEYGFYIQNVSATNGAQNNTIKNSVITLNRANTLSIGIIQLTNAAPTNATGANSGNKFYNLTITNANAGILLNGLAGFPDIGCEIGTTSCALRNSIGDPAVTNDITNTLTGAGTGAYGIRMINQSGFKVFNNDISNISTSGANSVVDGIFIDNGSASVALGTSEVYNNKINSVYNTNTGTNANNITRGIRINNNAQAGTITRVYNNFIGGIQSASTNTTLTTRRIIGLSLQPAGGGGASSIYAEFNTVRIAATNLALSNTCLEIGVASGPIFRVRNNILANVTAAQSGNAKHYTWVSTSASAIGAAGSLSNYNDLYVLNTNGFVGLGNATDYATLANWQTATSNDANSVSVDPLFVSTTDLHAGSPLLNGAADPNYATNTSWVTTDIDCAPRNTATDIGADEYDVSGCAGTPSAGTISASVLTLTCSGSSQLGGTGQTLLDGITYQWEVAPDVAGAPGTFAAIGGATTSPYTVTGITATTWYRLVVTCANGGATATSSNVKITVNAPTAGTASASLPSRCTGQTTVLSSTGFTASGVNWQWQVSGTPGGPYTNVTGGTGATTTSYTTGALAAGTYYYVLQGTCAAGSATPVLSNEVTVTVNALPTVGVTPPSATYCIGGSAIALTATGASTYAWSPATGLSAATGANVNASPIATTTYTVTGTDGNGCQGTATSVITAAATPTNVVATATPTAVCSGSTTSLSATASAPNTAALPSAYIFTGAAGTYSAISGTAVAGAIGDDVGVGNLPIGFTFIYNGIAQTVFGVSSNGLIQLGNTSATFTGLSSNVLASTANTIAPLWEDNNTTGGSVQYTTTGAAGSRILTVQWTGMHVGGSGGSSQPTINLQVKLYENTGVVQFVYGATSAAFTSTTASIGITGNSGNYLSLTPANPASSSTVSSSSENTTVSSATNFPTGTTYTFTPPSATLTYSWAPSGSVVNPSNQTTLTNPLSSPTLFTVTASNAGCTAQGTVNVAVNPLPPATTDNGTLPNQCGVPTYTVTAVGGATSYFWYTVASGGTPVATTAGPTYSYTGYTPGSTNTLYISYSNGTCESDRVMISVNSTTAPALTISQTGTVQTCSGRIETLSVTSTLSDYSTFIWSPSTNLYTDAAATIAYTGTSATTVYYKRATATAGEVITLNASNSVSGCSNAVTVTFAVNSNPIILSATATPNPICSGSTLTLTGTSASGIAAGNSTSIGTGTTLTTANGVEPTAFNNRYSQYWSQSVYTAAELQAAGLVAGNITALTFNITTNGDATTNANYSIRIGTTAGATVTAFTTTGLTTVYGPVTQSHSVGLNTITLSTPYPWDGVSNIIVDVRHDGANSTNNAITYYTATAGNTIITAVTTTASGTTSVQALVASASVTPALSTKRLNIVFAGQVGTINTGSLNWSWSDGAATVLSSASGTVIPTNVTGSPINITYTATATDPTTTCSSTLSASAVLVNPLPTVPTTVATGLTATGTGFTTINGSFTAAPAPVPTGYLVVRTTTGAPQPNPSGTYTVGTSGIGYIEYVNTTPGSWTSTGLTAGTGYDYWVFSYNSNSCGILYSATAATTTGTTLTCPTYSGSITVGATGTFTNLTNAISSLLTCGYTGNIVLELQSDYSSAGETFPITFPIALGASAAKTITVRPAAGVTASIAGSSTVAIIKINGADYITIDGSNNGTTTRDLTVANSSTGTSSTVIWLASTTAPDGATNNTIKNLIVTGNGSATTFGGIMSTAATLGNQADISNSNNTYQNNLITGAYYGIGIAGMATTMDANNTVANNLIGSTVAAGKIGLNGIFASNQSNVNISGNTVFGVTTNVTNLAGILLSGAYSNGIVANNKVSDIKNSAAQQAFGIQLSSSTAASNLTVYNNMIFDVSCTGTNGNLARGAHGIAILTGGGYKLYYNTVNLNTDQGGTTAVNAALYVAASITGLDVQNNILMNSMPSASTRYAIYSASANTAFTTIDYNDYVSSGAALGYIGSARTDLAAIIAGFSQNANSVNITPVFVSTTDMHLAPASNSLLDDKGSPVMTGFTTDIDGETRPWSGSTRTDMGADEIFVPLVADGGISAITFPAAFCPGVTNVSVTVTNFGSVPLTSVKVDWSVNGAPQPQFDPGVIAIPVGGTATYVVGTFNFLAATVYTITASTTLPNNSTDANTTNDALTINNVTPGLSGTYTVGAGQNFTTLTAAVAAYNARPICGPVTFLLKDAAYAETAININANTGASATNTLTIKPDAGVNATVSGTINNNGIIKLNGADYIIIDGSNNGTTSKNLTFLNSSGNANSSVIWIASTASDGATNNVVKNSIITGAATAGGAVNYGILSGSGTTVGNAAQTANSNNIIQNNTVIKANNGIYARGNTAAPYNENWVITGNTVGSLTAAEYVVSTGIVAENMSNVQISENIVTGVVVPNNANNADGITLTGSIAGGSVFNNKISNVRQNGTSTFGYAGRGLVLSATTTTGTPLIYNNFIADISAYGYDGYITAMGLYVSGGGGYRIYHNSVSLSTPLTVTTSDATAFYVAGSVTGGVLDVRNNIFSNTMSAGSGYTFAIGSNASASAYGNLDYNDYSCTGANLGFTPSVTAQTLADIQTGLGQNTHSISIAPVFVSATDLHLVPASNLFLGDQGVVLPAVTVDIDNDTRPLGASTVPDMGADEYNTPLCTGASGGTATASTTTICNSGTAFISSVGYSGGFGTTYQWQSSTDNFGAVITNIGTATNIYASLITPVINVTTYFRLKVICPNTSSTAYSNIITIQVNNPAFTTAPAATPTAQCGPGSVTLTATASAGATVNWFTTASGGTSIGTGSPLVIPTVSATTTYYAAAEVASPVTGTIGIGEYLAEESLNISPFDHYYGGEKLQYLVLASELTASGLSAGNITSLTFHVSGNGGILYQGFNVSMGATALTNLTSTPVTGLTSVYSTVAPAGLTTPSIGNCTITFSTPYNWDGVSNIVVQTCYSNNNGGGQTTDVLADYVTFDATNYYRADNSTSVCAAATATLGLYSDARPQMTFGGQGKCASARVGVTATINPQPSAVTIVASGSTPMNCGDIKTLTASGGITNEVVSILSQDFNAPTNNWTTTNLSAGGTPANAAWTLRPDGYSYFDATFGDTYGPYHSNDNSQFYHTNSDAQGSGGTTQTILTSPAFSTVGFGTANLSFYHAFTDPFLSASGSVQVSTDGANWTNVKVYNLGSEGTYSSFVQQTFALTAPFLNQPTVYVRFKFDASWDYFWAIDNVVISGNQTIQQPIVWSPTEGLYTDAAATIPYTGGNASVVYAAPTAATTTYQATAATPLPANCNTFGSVTVTVNPSGNWVGKGVTGDWEDIANWCGGVKPTISTAVSIPVLNATLVANGTLKYPEVKNVTPAFAGSITIAAGAANLLINSGATLSVAGNVASSGTLTNNGTIRLVGNTLQTFPGTGTIPDMYNLEIANTGGAGAGVKLTKGFGITNELKPTSGNLELDAFDIAIRSTLAATAYVSEVKPAASFSYNGIGRFSVERFINTGNTAGAHRRTWQFLSVPTTTAPSSTAQTIKSAWQEGAASPSANPVAGYGTRLSSNRFVAAGAPNGFDEGLSTAGPGIKTYRGDVDDWDQGPLNTNEPIANIKGWMVFVRGDRTVTGSSAPTAPTTLRTRGALFTGTQTGISINPEKYGSIGNPYASAIDLTKVDTLNVTNEVYVWDPTLGDGYYGFGRFRTLTKVGDHYEAVPFGGAYPAGISDTIQSGQAIFYKARPGAVATIGFKETAKSSGSRLVNRGGSEGELLTVTLSSLLYPGAPVLLDGAAAIFGKFSGNVDSDDGLKITNSNENTGFRRNGSLLAVERRPAPVNNDTLHLDLNGAKQQSYNWKIAPRNIDEPGRAAWLIDRFLNTTTSISLTDTSSYDFVVNNNAASYAPDRFKIVFKVNVVLPVTITGISAVRNPDRSIKVKWSVENELNIDKYEVERSADGIRFSGIITTAATNSRSYAKDDLSPLAQDNYYRIKATGNNGQVQYSAIVKVAPLKSNGLISVYPNPVEGKTINLRFTDMTEGSYQLQLTNKLGQVVYSGMASVTAASFVKNITLSKVVTAGTYQMKIVDADGKAVNIQVVVQ
ncbi:fibronectin type III domain-containing protein [Ferruginibacter sp. HRS2-29]|uniref:Ig-like domain-containing protein n=1 Tax=Ferruginibacter sp. HRS2-29 TaxID=2487334 RepID=UPI0020CCEBB5|nr:fibronectin type III domain-containing protein [Ferruginibacter sp. HRS2-29]